MREPAPPQNPVVAATARAKLAPHERAALDARARARARWPALARLGRHGFAMTGTGVVAVALLASALPHGLWQAPSWAELVRGIRSIGPASIGLVAVVLGGCYAMLLQRFDRHRRLAGAPPVQARLRLEQWRAGTARDDEPGDRPATSRRASVRRPRAIRA